MSFVYTPAKVKLLNGGLDLDTQDIRVMLVMTNTDADTLQDAEFVADLDAGANTLDEMDGATYVRKALAGEVVNTDLPNDRGEFDANDVTWTTLGAGTRQVAGMILFRFVTNDADSPLIAYIDAGGFPFPANGGDVTVTWNAEGILQAT